MILIWEQPIEIMWDDDVVYAQLMFPRDREIELIAELNKLTHYQRQAVLLSVFERISKENIADKLKISISRLKTEMQKAYSRLDGITKYRQPHTINETLSQLFNGWPCDIIAELSLLREKIRVI